METYISALRYLSTRPKCHHPQLVIATGIRSLLNLCRLWPLHHLCRRGGTHWRGNGSNSSSMSIRVNQDQWCRNRNGRVRSYDEPYDNCQCKMIDDIAAEQEQSHERHDTQPR